jgi:undecaprenyl diphosphate synthase
MLLYLMLSLSLYKIPAVFLDINHIPNYFGKLNLLYSQMVLSEENLKKIEKLKAKGKIPEHVAVIMDGNGRWAKAQGLPRVVGHREGIKTVRKVVETSANLGIKYLTLYTFSTENWKRPQTEVSTLMQLIVKSLKDETDDLHKNDIKLTAIGDLSKLPLDVQRELYESFEKTASNKKMTLNLALSYSGRLELINAVKAISEKVKNGLLSVEEIGERTIDEHLFTKNMPDPDLLIRTGGEFRVSNFLLWQIAYAEIYVTRKLWPEFTPGDFLDAIDDFQKRERRFGLVSEQINNNEQKIDNAKNGSITAD